MINILKRLNLIYDNFLLNKPMILNAEFENGYTLMKANALYFLARPLNNGGLRGGPILNTNRLTAVVAKFLFSYGALSE